MTKTVKQVFNEVCGRAIMMNLLSPGRCRKPGSFYAELPQETKDILKNLKSEDTQDILTSLKWYGDSSQSKIKTFKIKIEK